MLSKKTIFYEDLQDATKKFKYMLSKKTFFYEDLQDATKKFLGGVNNENPKSDYSGFLSGS